MATAFDTLSTYEAIAAAGIDDKGARAISKAIADSIIVDREGLATKADLLAVKSGLAELRVVVEGKLDVRAADLRELIVSTQNRTMIWMFGMLASFAGIIIAAQKLL